MKENENTKRKRKWKKKKRKKIGESYFFRLLYQSPRQKQTNELKMRLQTVAHTMTRCLNFLEKNFEEKKAWPRGLFVSVWRG